MADEPIFERRKNPARKRNVSTPPHATAETARQEGSQGRLGKSPGDTLSDGQVDASDPRVVE